MAGTEKLEMATVSFSLSNLSLYRFRVLSFPDL